MLNHHLRVSSVGGWLHCSSCGRKVVARTAYGRDGHYWTRFQHVKPYEQGMLIDTNEPWPAESRG